MIEEILRIENENTELVLERDGKKYGIRIYGIVKAEYYLGKQLIPTSIIYTLKSGDIENIMHTLIDRDKL